jgi:deoxycytidine triphosphate deaminase
MFLGVDKLLELVKTKDLVEGLCERELENPEGCGFDLRLSEVFRIKGEGYLGVEDRKTCDVETVASIKAGDKEIVLKPGDFYLVKTMEKVNMPSDLVGILKPRTTLQRMGIFLRTSQVAPGYSGELTFGLANLGPCQVKLDLGARIVHLMFAQVDGATSLYRGQWQGGRITTQGNEKQV